ncbi:hypothetical protein [Wenjunlia tyrosinilytica]|nr:hypothetical protein [Wenjunlia tyrosinilytica]
MGALKAYSWHATRGGARLRAPDSHIASTRGMGKRVAGIRTVDDRFT